MNGTLLVSDYIENRYADRLDRLAPELARVVLTRDGPSGPPETVVASFFSSDLYPERAAQYMMVIAQATRLRWLHSFSAGVDHPAFLALMDRGVRLSHSAGCNAVPVAHTAVMYVLALSRGLPAWMENARAKVWKLHEVGELEGKVLAVLGLGHIGSQVVRLGKALGMRVIGMRRRPRGDETVETWPLDRLNELLAAADYLVLCLPLNDGSRRVLDDAALRRMKPGAYLINVGRGELIEEAALVSALQEGRIAGAALDVFEQEPLPASSPLWEMDNVIVTPHNAGQSDGSATRATELFLDNLGRYLRGQGLRNEMTPAATQV
ncbi:MAG: D-2-hydroxyacid dehydrogenase [Candidatus Binatia bacterium]